MKTIKAYSAVTVFCMVFAAVYEAFSHQVYSVFMLLSPMIPFAGGVVIMLLLKAAGAPKPCRLAMSVYNRSMATFTVGSMIFGVFDIYGSSPAVLPIYWGVGIVLFVSAVVIYMIQLGKNA